MRVESEAALLGVVFTETGIMTGAPFRVRNADHWAFAGTGLRRRRPLRPREPAQAMPGRGVGSRDGQGLGRTRHRTSSCSPRVRTSTTAAPS